jgi:NAD(P)-dependent dehydrogenase (short-subunit alcohol dehydrogenase family)
MDSKRYTGKNVIITGAGSGIGQATAFRFAEEGAEVLIIGRRKKPLEDTVSKITAQGKKAWYYSSDVTKSDEVQAAVDAAMKRWGRIDILINNAGVDHAAPFLEVTEENWDMVVDTNLKGTFLWSQRVGREMAKTGGGVILINASMDALGGDGLIASYNSSKAGLLGLNRMMAIELAEHNIRVAAVCPGWTYTPMLDNSVSVNNLKYLKGDFKRTPMHRMVKVEEVAAAFAFLASDDASAITGSYLVVDCGLTANWYVEETFPEPAH